MKAVNRRAKFDYHLLESFEAGVVLSGPEVKSARQGWLNFSGSFVRLSEGEAWLHNLHINPYPCADNKNYDPKRTRKLLLHQSELLKISQKIKQNNLTLVPVSCYTRRRRIKFEIALARGKKKYEKREAIKKRDLERDILGM
ncbi:MAG: SsrA-binding protein SmpB [Candidatus Shapirobacteria bacterium]